jgi:hypothetical protein
MSSSHLDNILNVAVAMQAVTFYQAAQRRISCKRRAETLPELHAVEGST